MRTIRLLSLLALLLALSGCALFPEQEDKTKDWSAQRLYSAASEAMTDGDYELAVDYLEKLEARYPFGRYALQAQLDIAYAYYKADEPESAIAAANRFIKLNPANPYVDYAYYLKGLANFNRSYGFLERYIPIDASQRDPGAALDAFRDLSDLVEKFPNSQYAEDARRRLIYLRNNLAYYEINVAHYYMRRGAFPAAVNRCNQVIERFPRTPAVKDALEIMIDAYTRMGLEDLAKDTERVLALNIEQGTFAPLEQTEPPPASLTRKVWDSLELDKN
jgi:outer membrane protein assembly factor BamD